jgi:hypothetical protein
MVSKNGLAQARHSISCVDPSETPRLGAQDGRLGFLTTKVRVHLDHFIGETVERGQTKAHLLSVFGGDSEIGAFGPLCRWCGLANGGILTFTVEESMKATVASRLSRQRWPLTLKSVHQTFPAYF